MKDAAQILSRATGLPSDEIRRIWDDVRLNQDKLAACPGPHLFEEDKGDRRLYPRHVCMLCGGWVTTEFARGYVQGMNAVMRSKP